MAFSGCRRPTGIRAGGQLRAASMADSDDDVIDLTADDKPLQSRAKLTGTKPTKKRASPAATAAPAAKKSKPAAKASKPHALLWICAAGKGQGRAWKQKALKVVGVYASKAAAEDKKRAVMEKHDCCGHGDILVGGTWEDEIDLVVRPVEEMGV